jgi:hypothetical protein
MPMISAVGTDRILAAHPTPKTRWQLLGLSGQSIMMGLPRKRRGTRTSGCKFVFFIGRLLCLAKLAVQTASSIKEFEAPARIACTANLELPQCFSAVAR